MKSKKFLLVMLISCIAMVGCATQNSKGQNYQEPDYPDEIEAAVRIFSLNQRILLIRMLSGVSIL